MGEEGGLHSRNGVWQEHSVGEEGVSKYTWRDIVVIEHELSYCYVYKAVTKRGRAAMIM